MPDPVLLAIAAAVAAKGAEALVAGGKTAVAAVTRLLRARFGAGTDERAALDEAITHPDDTRRQQALAAVLGRAAADDPAFGDRLRGYGAAIVAETNAGVVNKVSGDVAGPVVQARDIHGNLSF